MSQSNASIAVAVDPFEDYRSKNTERMVGSGAGAGAGRELPNIDASLKSFKEMVKGEPKATRVYKLALQEAVRIIESLQELKVLPQSSRPPNAAESPTIAKILQEIQTIKRDLALNHGITKGQTKPWAKVASLSEVAGTTIRITDEEEKKKIAQLSSKELVDKIGAKEVIGARNMKNGQMKVFFAEQGIKDRMETQKDWTKKLATTAQIASPTYQVLIHGMPLSFMPENSEHIAALQRANESYIQGLKIQRATWLKKAKPLGKTTGSMIVWFELAEHADKAIAKGIVWNYEIKVAEIFRSGFRAMQCFNCQKFGHIARTCTAEAKCGSCAGEHNTRECPGKQNLRCCNCGKKHAAWDQSCPTKLAAKYKAVINRTNDPSRYQLPVEPSGDLQNGWQIVGSRKRRACTSTVEIARPVGEVIGRRGPGRPRKTHSAVPDTLPHWAKLTTSPQLPIPSTQESRTVTRENQEVISEAPQTGQSYSTM